MNWNAGELINQRWEIHRVLKGGMGIVYIVYDRHPEFRRVFAAKTFQDNPFQQRSNVAQAFYREATTWIGLDIHPNIARAHYLHEINGKPYLFIEYVNGGDLSKWIGSPRLINNPAFVLELAMQFSFGMVHAVAKGLAAHRDIKPQNCLLTPDGNLKITDFGLAKILDGVDIVPAKNGLSTLGDLTATKTGTSMGTPTHMAPEQFISAKNVDIRADIYSFGVMLFQMLSGTLPFQGRTWEDYKYHHLNTRPPRLSTGFVRLDSLLEKSLAKAPNDRFPDFSALRQELTELYRDVTGRPIREPVVGTQLTAFDLCNKGACLCSLGLYDAAISSFQEAFRLFPDDERTWLNMGVAYHKKGDYQRACKCYEKAITINANFGQAYYNYGLLMFAQDRKDDAAKFYQKAIKTDRHLKDAWIGLARVFKVTKAEHAEKCYNEAVQIAPNDSEVLDAYARFLTETNRPQQALQFYNKALALNDQQDDIWLNRGVALESVGDFTGAIESYDTALVINPENEKAWSFKAMRYFDLRNIAKLLWLIMKRYDLTI